MGGASPSPDTRHAIRGLLASNAAYQTLDDDTRRVIASSMVRIADAARTLSDGSGEAAAPQARSLSAGTEFSGVAAQKIADTTRSVLNAVSFPRFVTELINGVFKALNDSNQQQLASYIELIQNVSSTLDGFADANVSVAGARSWLAERFPGQFVVEGDDAGPPEAGQTAEERREVQAERDASTKLRLAPGAQMPTPAALRLAFGLSPDEPAPPSGDPEALVPLARAALARNRQKMLSTMVMMGLQRIVIESGRLNAAMRFHIDTRSAAAADAGSSFDARTTTGVSGGAKFGPWGAEAKVQNTIGFVSTQRSQTTEEMNTDLDLSSNVELIFKTDYVQLDRLAGGPAQERIRVNALNPDAEARLASAARTDRQKAQEAAETARSTRTADDIRRPPGQPLPSGTRPQVADGASPRPEASQTGQRRDPSQGSAPPAPTPASSAPAGPRAGPRAQPPSAAR